MFLNWKDKVAKMNTAIEKNKQRTRPFTEQEFLMGLGIIIGASEFAQTGKELFKKSASKFMEEKEDDWHTLTSHPHFEQYMVLPRFKEFQIFLPSIFVDGTKIESDPWYQFSDAVEEFNEIRRKRVVGSLWISVDESMSAWKPRAAEASWNRVQIHCLSDYWRPALSRKSKGETRNG
jgi:hypothetical protein